MPPAPATSMLSPLPLPSANADGPANANTTAANTSPANTTSAAAAAAATSADHLHHHHVHTHHNEFLDGLLKKNAITTVTSIPASADSADAPYAMVREVQARIPTDFGSFQLVLYTNNKDNKEHLAMTYGNISVPSRDLSTGLVEPVPVRVHSECFTGEVMGSRRCDCGEQLERAMKFISNYGRGVIVFLRQEGRGIGLLAKLRAYNIQDKGYDTVEANLLLGRGADERDFTPAALILKDLGITDVKLLTNNPFKMEALQAHGITVHKRLHMQPEHISVHNRDYFVTKVKRLRHLIEVTQDENNKETVTQQQDDLSPALLAPSTPPSEPFTQTELVASASTPVLPSQQPEQLPHQHSADPADPDASSDVRRAASLARVARDTANRPYVTLTFAQSLDGCITQEKGRPLALSGEESMRMTHRLRAEHEGILVGINTVLSDNPRLTVRLVNGENPQPVVLDSALKTPLSAKLFENDKLPWIVCSQTADAAKEKALVERGATVIRVATDSEGILNLPAVLSELKKRRLNTVMVEGGASVIRSFLKHPARVFDRLVVTIAPVIVAGQHATAADSAAQNEKVVLPQLRNVSYEQLGKDMVLSAEPYWLSA